MSTHADVIAAVQGGDASAIRELLAGDPSLAAAKDANGVSAVMHAFYARQPQIAEALIAGKPTLDIFEATAAGKQARVAQILEDDPDSSRRWSADGFTALHFAAFFHQPGIARDLVERRADLNAVSNNTMKVTPLHSAAAAHSREILQFLLTKGALPNARQQGGWTALHAAAQNGDAEMVLALLQYGADRHMRSDDGKVPADIAAEKSHSKIIELLSQ